MWSDDWWGGVLTVVIAVFLSWAFYSCGHHNGSEDVKREAIAHGYAEIVYPPGIPGKTYSGRFEWCER